MLLEVRFLSLADCPSTTKVTALQTLGTHTLFCHIGTSSSGRWVMTRQFSVVPQFQPGGTTQFYGQLPPVAQFGLQQLLLQLNTSSGGVVKDIWAVSSCWNVVNHNNFAFMLQCLPTARLLSANKGAVGASLTYALHMCRELRVNGEEY